MSDVMNGTAVDPLDLLSAYDSLMTAEMRIVPPGQTEAIGVVVFAGPGHPQAIALADELTREALQRNAARDQAMLTGDKPPQESVKELRATNVKIVVDRIVEMRLYDPKDGVNNVVVLSKDMIAKILADPRKAWLFRLCRTFLDRDTSFTNGSGAT